MRLQLPGHFKHFLLIGLFVLSNISTGSTAPNFEISQVDSIEIIREQLLLFVDNPPFLKLEEVAKQKFEPYWNQEFHTDPVEKANKRYWLQLSLKNDHVDKSKQGYLYFGRSDRILSYNIKEGNLIEYCKSGAMYKGSMHGLSPHFNLIPISLEPNEELNLLVHLSSASHMMAEQDEILVNYIVKGYEDQILGGNPLSIKKGYNEM